MTENISLITDIQTLRQNVRSSNITFNQLGGAKQLAIVLGH